MKSIKLPDFKKMREDSGFTLREVETHTKISNAYLSQLENNKIKKPSYETVITLVEFYKNNQLNGWQHKWNQMLAMVEESMKEADDEKRIAISKGFEELNIKLNQQSKNPTP
jgi:transcriptional regulator with XRE-family HTH domain